MGTFCTALPGIRNPVCDHDDGGTGWNLLVGRTASHIRQARRNRHRSVLVRNILSPMLHRLPAELRQLLTYFWKEANDHDGPCILRGWCNRRGGLP